MSVSEKEVELVNQKMYETLKMISRKASEKNTDGDEPGTTRGCHPRKGKITNQAYARSRAGSSTDKIEIWTTRKWAASAGAGTPAAWIEVADALQDQCGTTCRFYFEGKDHPLFLAAKEKNILALS